MEKVTIYRGIKVTERVKGRCHSFEMIGDTYYVKSLRQAKQLIKVYYTRKGEYKYEI